jgi:hypothetical protein
VTRGFQEDKAVQLVLSYDLNAYITNRNSTTCMRLSVPLKFSEKDIAAMADLGYTWDGLRSSWIKENEK